MNNKADGKDYSEEWLERMKKSIITTGGKYSTARMLVDYSERLYMPLVNLYNNYYPLLPYLNFSIIIT